ncbi:hypothetical protein L1887_63509 [Cichorium endivia]|nr:hypothetical protein L1887_63509 [Cichorium endivia]
MTALTTLARDVLHMHTSGLRGKVEQDTASAEADSVRMLESLSRSSEDLRGALTFVGGGVGRGTDGAWMDLVDVVAVVVRRIAVLRQLHGRVHFQLGRVDGQSRYPPQRHHQQHKKQHLDT